MKRTTSWFDIVLAAVLAAALLGLAVFATDLFVLPFFQGKFSGKITMPDLRGLDSAAARQTLSESHLELGGDTCVYSATVTKGRVVQQAPLPGQELKTLRRVHLIFSLGAEQIKIPDLRELSPSQASDTLQRLGFRLGETREVYDASMTPGAIISSSPRAGKMRARGSAVDITISQTRIGDQTYVPDFTNVSLAQARALITRYALRLRQVTTRPEPDLVPGTVVGQSIKAGSKVDRETLIDFTVSE
ncbi:MAG: PASTA domain-containing protein [Fibrobacterota bacterium]